MTNSLPEDWPKSINPYKEYPPKNSVGIVIPMRDNLKFFKLAFHSVMSFTDYPFMLTIINNMSTLTTEKRLKSMMWNHPISVLKYQENFNYAAEVNQGIHHMFQWAGVKYGLALNSDVVVEPEWLSLMVSIMEKDPKIGIVGPVSNKAIQNQEKQKANMAEFVDYVSGFCMMFRREVFENLNGFDESYSGGCYEDQDFCYRARRNGWESVVARPVHIHHFWKVTRGKIPSINDQVIKNRDLFLRKFPEIRKDPVVA